MAIPAEVTWVKTDPSGAEILKISGTRRSSLSKSRWELSVDQAIALVELDKWRFYVEVENSKERLEVVTESISSKTFRFAPIRALM